MIKAKPYNHWIFVIKIIKQSPTLILSPYLKKLLKLLNDR